MSVKKKALFLLIVLLVLSLSCALAYPVKTTLKDAERTMQVDLPVPEYLPAGYKIWEIYLTEKNNALFAVKQYIAKLCKMN